MILPNCQLTVELLQKGVLQDNADAGPGVRAVRPEGGKSVIAEGAKLRGSFAFVGVSLRDETEIPVGQEVQHISDFGFVLGWFGAIKALGIP